MSIMSNVKWLPQENTVELLFATSGIDEQLVCSVFGFVFNEKSQLLLIKKEKGWDIPGGGKENLESPIDAVKREIFEEASVIVQKVEPIAVNKLTLLQDMPPEKYWRTFPISYEFYFRCNVKSIEQFQPNIETGERKFFDLQDVYQQEGINFGNRKLILERIINGPDC